MTCAKMSKVPKSARCRKIGTREMTGMDWSVFAPVNGRILNLLEDGKSRSVREVCDAIGSKSLSHARIVLFELAAKGVLETAKERRGNHAVDCFRAALKRR